MPRKPQLQEWEVALIRAMLATGNYTKQQIVCYFSRPDRSVNQGRISEISDRHERYEGIAAADSKTLLQFLDDWQAIQFPEAPKVDYGPVHLNTLGELFELRKDGTERLAIAESDWVEGKETFNWGSREKYTKTLAGLANNRGGYILFGVQDGSFVVNGIPPDRMDKFDLKKAHTFLSRSLNLSLRIEKNAFKVGDKTVGAMYVHEADVKPVICKIDVGGLCSGDVYYRYAGETRRIQAPELEILLRQRDKSANAKLLDFADVIQEIGTDNAAVMNLETGAVDGENGRFYISEELLSKLSFIKEGEFMEAAGAPTLTVIGDVQPQADNTDIVERKVKENITERDMLSDFLEQNDVGNPKAYIEQLIHIQAFWLPVYYFAMLAGLTKTDLEKFIKEIETPYENRRARQLERIALSRRPANLHKPDSFEREIGEISSHNAINIENEEHAKKYLEAIQLIDPESIELERMLSVVANIYKRFGSSHNLRGVFRYAATHIDYMWFRPLVETEEKE